MNEPYQEADRQRKDNLPIAKGEDVEFSSEVADEDDMEAVQRAESAEQRQQND